ncbi:MAG TPA: acyl-CoA thioesterase II [Phenylobacterium sp.]|jgi:acyl-CoA thioesterase-2|nr:acyl-CoA thioesterase II [Phenylobacterium sp.]
MTANRENGGQTLIETLGLERLEVNLFRGTTPDAEQRQRIYGGQVIAQSLLAAYETVEDRVCHSLHCYFIRPGDPSIPIVFEVDRSRDGGSFTTRRVIAVQHGQQIFNLAASFQTDEQGYEHQSDMPDAPAPDEVEGDAEARKRIAEMIPPEDEDWIDRHQPIEMKTVGGRFDEVAPKPGERVQQVWFRATDPIGGDPRLHQVVMAYASDMSLLGTSIRPHGVSWRTPGFQAASLDHAMWFHRPTDFNQWHLYQQESPSAAGGRGFNLGYIYRASDGALVASCAQEGLMRLRKPKS